MDDKKDIQVALFGGVDLQQLEIAQKPKKIHYNAPLLGVTMCYPDDWRYKY